MPRHIRPRLALDARLRPPRRCRLRGARVGRIGARRAGAFPGVPVSATAVRPSPVPVVVRRARADPQRRTAEVGRVDRPPDQQGRPADVRRADVEIGFVARMRYDVGLHRESAGSVRCVCGWQGGGAQYGLRGSAPVSGSVVRDASKMNGVFL